MDWIEKEGLQIQSSLLHQYIWEGLIFHQGFVSGALTNNGNIELLRFVKAK